MNIKIKMLEREMEESQKLEGLEVQIGEIEKDFKEMKTAREENNKQLAEKFKEIYKGIR